MRDPYPYRRSIATRALSLVVLLAPAAALGTLAVNNQSAALATGTAVEFLMAALFVRFPAVWRPPAGGPVILFYLIALGWVWFNPPPVADALTRGVRGGLLIAPVLLLAAVDLHRTGAEPRRRAARLCRKLRNRSDWPASLPDVRSLPEVRGLHEIVNAECGPVFDLFKDPRPEVRAAAFAALAARRRWRPREAAALLKAAQKTAEPGVRAVAVAALGAVSDPATLAALAGFLRDPHAGVRRAAAISCTDDAGQKWAHIRDGVRNALADPKLAADGGLPGTAGYLSAVAVCDLTVWSGEGEPLGPRAARVLIDHYGRVVPARGDQAMAADLGRQVTHPDTPPGLRVELAGLLRSLGMLTPDLLDRMTNADQPGPVRLLAAEALLANNPEDADGIDVLRGIARQPNRELALATARIIQTYLGVDMGLPDDAVPAKSKQAGDVARRVMMWATDRRPAPKPSAEPSSPW